MPRAEKKVNSRIMVTIMLASTFSANPLSLIQACKTLRSGYTSACGAGSRGKSFINFLIGCAMLNSLVRKHRSELGPTGIANRFCHIGLFEPFGADVANGNMVELAHKPCRKLVQNVSPAIRDLYGNLRGLASFPAPLRRAKLFLEFLIMARVCDLLSGGKRGQVFQPKVYADRTARKSFLGVGDLDHNIQIPIASGVLAEAGAVANLPVREIATREHAKDMVSKAEPIAMLADSAASDGNPPQRLLAAIAKIRAPILLSRPGILLAHFVYRGCRDIQFGGSAGCELHQVERRWPLLAPFEGVLLRIVAKIPDEIAGPSLPVEQPRQGFNAIAVSCMHGFIIAGSGIGKIMTFKLRAIIDNKGE